MSKIWSVDDPLIEDKEERWRRDVESKLLSIQESLEELKEAVESSQEQSKNIAYRRRRENIHVLVALGILGAFFTAYTNNLVQNSVSGSFFLYICSYFSSLSLDKGQYDNMEEENRQ